MDAVFYFQLQKEPPLQDKESHFSPVIQIKDEPIDEDYDKALVPQSDTSNVKQEVNEIEVRFRSDVHFGLIERNPRRRVV